MANVILQKVTKVFEGGILAVKDVDIEINDKEFIVIVGPSGCGKTTILRLIAGLEELSAGKIIIADRIVNDVPPKDRDIAMVFQNYALYPHMTVRQNMAFALKLRKLPKPQIKKTVEETAKMLGIESLLARKPKALSGGQRQRVALGRAIVRKPKAFLFDEPLSNLDARLRVTTRTELKALHQKLQTTCIYVTHDQTEAMTLGQRICVMNRGLIRQIAPPMQLYDHPVDRFVAEFLGTPPMNFFDGIIKFDNDRAGFLIDNDSLALPDSFIPKLRPHQGKPMVLGIRPENLSLAPTADKTQNVIAAKVTLIEPLGDRMDVVLETAANRQFIINIDPHTKIKTGDSLRIHPHTTKAIIFEPGPTGKNITSN